MMRFSHTRRVDRIVACPGTSIADRWLHTLTDPDLAVLETVMGQWGMLTMNTDANLTPLPDDLREPYAALCRRWAAFCEGQP